MKTLEDGSFLTCFTAYGGPLAGQSVWLSAETSHGCNALYVPVLVPLDEEALKRDHVSPTMMLCPVAELPAEVIQVAIKGVQELSDVEARNLVFEGVCSCEHCRRRAM